MGDASRTRELIDVLESSSWFMDVLGAVATADPPDWWVGAGVVRDLVWDVRFGAGFDPRRVRDVDVTFFDAVDLRRQRDADVEQRLYELRPDIPWDAKNQAAVHLWYPERFGIDVAPCTSMAESVATWPETATAVAVRLEAGSLAILAPHGLDDLLDGVWRWNPVRATEEEYRRRLERKHPAHRWPGLRIVPAG